MPTDKLLHILVGISVAAVLIAAIGKELYDRAGYGTPDLLDAVSTVAGGLVFTDRDTMTPILGFAPDADQFMPVPLDVMATVVSSQVKSDRLTPKDQL